jgi:hypothetical protein
VSPGAGAADGISSVRSSVEHRARHLVEAPYIRSGRSYDTMKRYAIALSTAVLIGVGLLGSPGSSPSVQARTGTYGIPHTVMHDMDRLCPLDTRPVATSHSVASALRRPDCMKHV